MCEHISIVLPNRKGQFFDVTSLLAENNINVLGYSLTSQGKTGLLYILPDKFDTAFSLLQSRFKFYCNKKEVVLVKVPNEPGQLTPILKLLADRSLNVDVSYQCTLGNNFTIIVLDLDSLDDTALAEKILRSKELDVLKAQSAK